MIFYVSRQNYYYSQESVVEVAAGGIDYAGADMLCTGYRKLGEGEEYTDPREAIEAAIKIRDAWRTDEPGKTINVAYGNTGGMGMELESVEEDADLRAWARETWEAAPKCDECGDALPDNARQVLQLSEFGSDYKFDTERCAERFAQRNNLFEDEEVLV